jgi:hypothetical protein
MIDIKKSFVPLAELGDYTSDEHSIENVSEFHFLPNDRQTEEFEEQVLQKWATYM